MPQMSPMLWFILFFYFILLFLFFNILNYFNFIPSFITNTINNKMIFKTKKNLFLNWKW